MSRWIDADALIKQIDNPYTEYPIMIQIRRAIKEFINSAPSIDIVRCKECKYASNNKVYGCMLNHFNDNDYDYHRMYADDFCSYGEREDE